MRSMSGITYYGAKCWNGIHYFRKADAAVVWQGVGGGKGEGEKRLKNSWRTTIRTSHRCRPHYNNQSLRPEWFTIMSLSTQYDPKTHGKHILSLVNGNPQVGTGFLYNTLAKYTKLIKIVASQSKQKTLTKLQTCQSYWSGIQVKVHTQFICKALEATKFKINFPITFPPQKRKTKTCITLKIDWLIPRNRYNIFPHLWNASH